MMIRFVMITLLVGFAYACFCETALNLIGGQDFQQQTDLLSTSALLILASVAVEFMAHLVKGITATFTIKDTVYERPSDKRT